MRLRALRDACLGGFLYGALLYGAVLSLVHVVHNHLGSARDALIAYAGCLLLYGLWSAAFFALSSLAAIPFSRPESQGRRDLVRRQYDHLCRVLLEDLGQAPTEETAREYHLLMG